MTLDPRLIATYIGAIAFDLIFPIIVGIFIHRRFGVRWRIFLYGALVFLVSQLLIRVPIGQVAQILLLPTLQSSQTYLYIFFAVLALTAGLFEEVGRYIGYRTLLKYDKTWQDSLMYGAGHGGLESMVLVGGLATLGLINTLVISSTDFSTLNLPSEQLAQIQAARAQIAGLDWWTPLWGAYERFLTIFFHISLSVLVLQTFLRRSLLWLVLAILLHALVDFGAIVLTQSVSVVWIYLALTLLLPLSLGITYYFRPRRIGMLGGTFDPPHNGHLNIVSAASRALNLDQVLFIPAKQPPHKLDDPVSPLKDRVAMLKLALKNHPTYSISMLEAARSGPSYTSDTLRQIRRNNLSDSRLYFIMGEDSLTNLPSWHQPEQIVELADLAVAQRPGFDPNLDALETQVPGVKSGVILIPTEETDISSTEIRTRAGNHESIADQVPPLVAAYIDNHHLYQNPPISAPARPIPNL